MKTSLKLKKKQKKLEEKNGAGIDPQSNIPFVNDQWEKLKKRNIIRDRCSLIRR